MAERENSTAGAFPAVMYVICFIVTVVILFTDKNLQTDFGSVKPYFVHWYGMLVIALIEIVASILLFTMGSRKLYLASLIGSLLLALFLVADIFTYSMVGFSSPQQFATYLFGVTNYEGNVMYIPGLYDVLFALLVVTSIASFFSYRKSSRVEAVKQ